MTEYRSVLERAGSNAPPPDLQLERVLRRRDRKRRNQRIAAGVAGIAIFAALVFGLARATLSGSGPLPAVPDQSPSPSIQTEALPQIIGDNEAVVMGRNSALDALDRTTRDRRTLVTCKDSVHLHLPIRGVDGPAVARVRGVDLPGRTAVRTGGRESGSRMRSGNRPS